jgi:hypothetical protein
MLLDETKEYLGKGLESPPSVTPIAIYRGGLAKDEKVEASQLNIGL